LDHLTIFAPFTLGFLVFGLALAFAFGLRFCALLVELKQPRQDFGLCQFPIAPIIAPAEGLFQSL
jgi:hypothetical protein